MMKWFKRKQAPGAEQIQETVLSPQVEDKILEPAVSSGFFGRIKQSLIKTRQQLGDGLGRLFLGKKQIDASVLDELETLLLSADLGVQTTRLVLDEITDKLARKDLADGDAVYHAVKTCLTQMLDKTAEASVTDRVSGKPHVILAVGVNGAGKTTSIGKLAKYFQGQGMQVMLAAGDTFRAAAVEQLQAWGARNQVSVIAQHTGADSASVIFDALQAATARGVDILIADTAGRLHTQNNLMQELKKIKRVMQKISPEAPHETLLVLDASIGQNALNQARQFHEEIGLTGIIMTKLDGSAKGGILFAIAHELGIPFRYIGIGEGIDDLRPFDSTQFVDAIFSDDHI